MLIVVVRATLYPTQLCSCIQTLFHTHCWEDAFEKVNQGHPFSPVGRPIFRGKRNGSIVIIRLDIKSNSVKDD
jgi:hypothetical protein